jgi:Skp family chaperone for outer membrane proteins
VKRFLLSSAVAAGMFVTWFAWTCFTGSQALAQPPMSSAQGPSPIALVDVNFIFKRHVRLRAQLKELGQDAERVQKDFEQQLQRLQEMQQQLNTMKPGTPDYQQKEESIVSQKSIIQGQIALKRKEFVQKEAHLYYNAYREITEEVAYYCQQRGILIVLNFNGDNINDQNADEIARGISNKVVFYNRALDITPAVLPRFVEGANANPNPPNNPNAYVPPPAFGVPGTR